MLHLWALCSAGFCLGLSDSSGHSHPALQAVVSGCLPDFGALGLQLQHILGSRCGAGSLALSSASSETAPRRGRLSPDFVGATLGHEESQHHQGWAVYRAGVQAVGRGVREERPVGGCGRGRFLKEAAGSGSQERGDIQKNTGHLEGLLSWAGP